MLISDAERTAAIRAACEADDPDGCFYPRCAPHITNSSTSLCSRWIAIVDAALEAAARAREDSKP